jgi:hypothetical protein
MPRRSNKYGCITLMIIIFLSSCGIFKGSGAETPNSFAKYTAAAETVGVVLTRESLLTPSATINPTLTFTETPIPTTAVPTETVISATLLPSSTATLQVNPDQAELISQSIVDGTQFTSGQAIKMIWVLRNIGSSTWTTAYSVKFFAGDQMEAPSTITILNEVKPLEQLEVSVDFIAPSDAGPKRSIWVLQNPDSENFYAFYLDIEVVSGTAPTPNPSP